MLVRVLRRRIAGDPQRCLGLCELAGGEVHGLASDMNQLRGELAVGDHGFNDNDVVPFIMSRPIAAVIGFRLGPAIMFGRSSK